MHLAVGGGFGGSNSSGSGPNSCDSDSGVGRIPPTRSLTASVGSSIPGSWLISSIGSPIPGSNGTFKFGL
jgi:hypothetical protein